MKKILLITSLIGGILFSAKAQDSGLEFKGGYSVGFIKSKVSFFGTSSSVTASDGGFHLGAVCWGPLCVPEVSAFIFKPFAGMLCAIRVASLTLKPFAVVVCATEVANFICKPFAGVVCVIGFLNFKPLAGVICVIGVSSCISKLFARVVRVMRKWNFVFKLLMGSFV